MPPPMSEVGEAGAAAAAAPVDDGSPIDPAIVREASLWLVKLWSGEAGTDESRACATWRQADPEHERAWRRLQQLSQKLHEVPAPLARRALQQPASAAGRRKVLGALGIVLAGGAGVQVLRESAWYGQRQAAFRTATGEWRELQLPDGTQVALNSGTAMDVAFDAFERRIVLRGGEILVTSAPDGSGAGRPLLVETAHGRAWALGTRYSVRDDGAHTRVAVFQGAVRLEARGGSSARLDAGQCGIFSATDIGAVAPVAEHALAWTRRQLVAERMPLTDFAHELQRYRTGIVRCDSAVAGLRVTGVFPLHDTDLALAALEQGLPVRVRFRTRYWATIAALA